MQVIVEKPFARYSIGHVIPEMPENQARKLIARGLVREDADAKVLRSPLDRMLRRGVKK